MYQINVSSKVWFLNISRRALLMESARTLLFLPSRTGITKELSKKDRRGNLAPIRIVLYFILLTQETFYFKGILRPFLIRKRAFNETLPADGVEKPSWIVVAIASSPFRRQIRVFGPCSSFQPLSLLNLDEGPRSLVWIDQPLLIEGRHRALYHIFSEILYDSRSIISLKFFRR